MIFFRADAVFASSISKFGNRRPSIHCDVSRSSTDSTISTSLMTISTSLIHNVASVGKLEPEHISVLKHFSNTEQSKGQGNYRNAFPRPHSSVVQPYNFADNLVQHVVFYFYGGPCLDSVISYDIPPQSLDGLPALLWRLYLLVLQENPELLDARRISSLSE